jgi:hypothetical protein
MELVLVYLGPHIPLYLEKNLQLLSVNFPLNPLVLLSDHQNEIERLKNRLPQVKFVLVSNPEVSWQETLSVSKFPQEFRDNFWGKTLARFYSIYEYMSLRPTQEILHIEADVWLSPNFPLHKFTGLPKLLAYPLTNHDQGVASTIYFQNFEAANLLKRFSEMAMSVDQTTTDVSVLGALHKLHSDEVLILPTAPKSDFSFHHFVDFDTKKKMSAEFNRFGGVFDASTWGQFITGEDPRNNVGVKLLYHHQLHHSICPMDFKYTYSSNRELVATQKDFWFEIFSLHIHSKNEKIFSVTDSADTIRSYCGSYLGKEQSEFFLRMFLHNVLPFIFYRVKLFIKKLVERT